MTEEQLDLLEECINKLCEIKMSSKALDQLDKILHEGLYEILEAYRPLEEED